MSRWLVLSVSLSLAIGIVVGAMLVLVSMPITSTPVMLTPIPTMVVVPVHPAELNIGHIETVRVSHYWPAYGGTNCSRFVNGECISRMASGERWQDWIGRAAACPIEWEFGTQIILPGGEFFSCQDRGSAIRYVGGITWIDLLVKEPPVAFGTLLEVTIIP
jgi:hypothetical protein